MSGHLSREDRVALEAIGTRVFDALRGFHAGVIFLEIECFLAPPRRKPQDIVPLAMVLVEESDGARLDCGAFHLRCQHDGSAWRVSAASHDCRLCGGAGNCKSCINAAMPTESCRCAGTGLCAQCQGTGRELFF